MRYEGLLLTERESRALIDDVDCWLRRTGTNYNKLVTAAGVAVSIRSMVRTKGKRVTITVAARLRQAMKDHRAGISREEHRQRVRMAPVRIQRPTVEEIEMRRVNREPCPRCGIRADIGCAHSAILSGNAVGGISRA